MSSLKTPSPAPDDVSNAMASGDRTERRSYGRVTRDDRDQAVVEWVKPPKDWDRPVFSLTKDEPVTASGALKTKGFDPYETSGGNGGVTWNTAPDRLKHPARTDLRKLSEHIKQMRALQSASDTNEK